MTVTKIASGRSSRQHGKHRFSEALAERIAKVPAEVQAIIYLAIRLLEFRNRDDVGISLYCSGIDVLEAAIQAYRPLADAFLGALSFPLATDCEYDVYLGVANAVATTVRRSKPRSIKAANALRGNLVGNCRLCSPLSTLAERAPEVVLSVLHDGLCADPDLASANDMVAALSCAKPGRRIVQEWLRSQFSGPRAAMLRYLALSHRFAEMVLPAAAEAVGEPRVVNVAGRPGCQSPA